MNLYSAEELDAGLQLAGQLISAGGLEFIDDARLRELVQGGLVGACCPDGDHQFDTLNHASRYTKRLHIAKLNGGAMTMAPTNPDFETRGRPLIESVVEGWQLGKGSAIGLFSHFPCGRARILTYDLRQVILDTLFADENITNVLGVSDQVVLPFLHVDWTPAETDLSKKERRT